MPRPALPALLALAVPLALAAPAAAEAPALPPTPAPAAPACAARELRVVGDGRLAVRPDVAVVNAGVETTGPEVAKVTAEASARMRRILQALAQVGVAEKDVQTTRHDLQVNRSWNDGQPGPITGYTAADEVRVKVRDLSKLGAVLERVVSAGSNALHGISFEQDDPAPSRRAALALAVAEARAKAEAIAKAAGVQLGELRAVEEGGGAPGPRPMMVAQGRLAAAGAPVAPGEVEVTAQVTATFAIR